MTEQEKKKYDLLLYAFHTVEQKDQEQSNPRHSFQEEIITKRAQEILDEYIPFLVMIINSGHFDFPNLNDIVPGQTCDCQNFPSHIFTNTEKMQLIREDFAVFDTEEEKEEFEDKLKDFIHSHIRAIGISKLRVLDIASEYHEKSIDFPTWYEEEIYETLFHYDDYRKLLEKMEEYAVQGLYNCGVKLSPEDMVHVGHGGYSDVAGLDELKAQLQSDFIDVMKEPARAKKLGLTMPNGMLLYGPPGCGKTYFAEKFAEEAGCNYIFINCSDIASRFVHGTQEKIAAVFEEALEKAPSIIFFDEVDAMIPKRGERGNEYTQTETNEFLTQLNNCGKRGIFAIGATNRPQGIDPAALRSGRLDMKVYFPLPDEETRTALFIRYLKDLNIKGMIEIDELVELTDGYVSADIEKIVDLATRKAFRQKLDYVTMDMLKGVITKFKPTVSKADLREYEDIRDKFEGRKQERPRIGFC